MTRQRGSKGTADTVVERKGDMKGRGNNCSFYKVEWARDAVTKGKSKCRG